MDDPHGRSNLMNYHSLRVAHICPALFDRDRGIIGGAERYALELARGMAQHVETRLLSFGARDESLQQGNLCIELIGGSKAIAGNDSHRFSIALLDHLEWADVVHCHQPHSAASIMAAEYCLRTSKAVFATDLGGHSGTPSGSRWHSLFDAHLHMSQFSETLAAHPGGVRSSVISTGVAVDRFTPSADYDPGSVLFVGRILPHKGLDVLIEALPPGMDLTIIGPAYDALYMEDLRRLSAHKRVTFLGSREDDELSYAYSHAACVVLPSVYQTMYGVRSAAPELLGQTLLEAMACGVPVICTGVGGMPEVVVDGVTGFIVPERDAASLAGKLEWLAANPEKAREMGARGRIRVLERFRWEDVIGRCLAEYRDARSVRSNSGSEPPKLC